MKVYSCLYERIFFDKYPLNPKNGMKYMSGSVIEVPGVLEQGKPNASEFSSDDL